MQLPDDIASWMRHFAAAVRQRDFAAGRSLCLPGIVSFGTVSNRCADLDQLVETQWHVVWLRTQGFDFDYATAVAWTDQDLAGVVSIWKSEGLGPQGPFPRRGRATILLRKSAGRWLACHTHLSMEPQSTALT